MSTAEKSGRPERDSDLRCQSGPSAKNSVIFNGGDMRGEQLFHFVSLSNADEVFDVSMIRDKFTSEIVAPLDPVRCRGLV